MDGMGIMEEWMASILKNGTKLQRAHERKQRQMKRILECLLIAFLILSFCGIATVRADGLIPMPEVRTERGVNGYDYGMDITQGCLHEAFEIGKFYNNPTQSMLTVYGGEIETNESDTWYDFQYQLFSYGDNASQILFNCLNDTIPALFINCGSFDMATTSVTRDSNNVPIWTNTVDLNNIPVATYGHTSMINIVLKQHFHADWTTLTIKTDVFADLTNLKLYTSKDNEVPQGTTYSLNKEQPILSTRNNLFSQMNSNPWEHTKWGVIILVFSIIGLGTLLGLIGGILALVYKPQAFVLQQPPMQAVTRICPKCGRVLREETKFCPYCGNELG